MRYTSLFLRQRIRAFCAIVFISVVPSARAIEKHWVVNEAELVAVGTFHEGITYPWTDGWRVTGTIEVSEVLYGPRPTREIKYRFVCRWGSECRYWPPPRFKALLTQKGIWFLRSVDSRTWGSPGNGDPGFRELSDRAEFERDIRSYKH